MIITMIMTTVNRALRGALRSAGDLDENARELYVTDSYLRGRVPVYDLDTLKFKHGWGAYRTTLGHLSFFGRSSGGGLHWVHMVATDSRGNVYTGEVDTGKRVQRFLVQR